MKYIDTHSHIYFKDFDEDREALFSRMHERNVQTITVGTGFLTSGEAVQAAIDTPEMVLGATVGVHPNHAEEGFVPKDFEGLFMVHERAEGALPLVVGIGECGLDYYRGADESQKKRQKEVFEAQIVFALEHNLPLMLHVRPSKGTDDAHRDALAILDTFQRAHGDKVRGTSHFFTASLEIAKEYWRRGFATSFPGVITFAKECEEVVREAPLNMVLAETDAPYAAPVPHRGKRNEPVFVVEVVRHIAQVRGVEEWEVAEALYQNTQRIFNVG